uniref:WAP domain-containing protein n=1 Tax=Pelusios castaneus TaxID=367368 RepID=A0A8C8S785_9SAUR
MAGPCPDPFPHSQGARGAGSHVLSTTCQSRGFAHASQYLLLKSWGSCGLQTRGVTARGLFCAPGRPGFCPRPTGPGPCVERCRFDWQCPPGQKCCSNGCGHECRKPIFAWAPGGEPL